jgi:hypothetical protein
MVGAGGSGLPGCTAARARMSFSNYGSRVDLQGLSRVRHDEGLRPPPWREPELLVHAQLRRHVERVPDRGQRRCLAHRPDAAACRLPDTAAVGSPAVHNSRSLKAAHLEGATMNATTHQTSTLAAQGRQHVRSCRAHPSQCLCGPFPVRHDGCSRRCCPPSSRSPRRLRSPVRPVPTRSRRASTCPCCRRSVTSAKLLR